MLKKREFTDEGEHVRREFLNFAYVLRKPSAWNMHTGMQCQGYCTHPFIQETNPRFHSPYLNSDVIVALQYHRRLLENRKS